MQQIDRCVTALAADRFAEHVDTDTRTVDEIVEHLGDRLNLQLERLACIGALSVAPGGGRDPTRQV